MIVDEARALGLAELDHVLDEEAAIGVLEGHHVRPDQLGVGMGDVDAVEAHHEQVIAIVEAGIGDGIERQLLGLGLLELALLGPRDIGVHGRDRRLDHVLHLRPLQIHHVDASLVERHGDTDHGDHGGQDRNQPKRAADRQGGELLHK